MIDNTQNVEEVKDKFQFGSDGNLTSFSNDMITVDVYKQPTQYSVHMYFKVGQRVLSIDEAEKTALQLLSIVNTARKRSEVNKNPL